MLPVVTFQELKSALEKMEAFLNLFHWEFEKTTTLFDSISPRDIIDASETTAYKAKAYDSLEAEGVIPRGEWQRRAERNAP